MRSFPGSRSAPTIVDDLLYVGSGLGNLFCINRADGKIIWSKDLMADFSGGSATDMDILTIRHLIQGERFLTGQTGRTVNNVVAFDIVLPGRLIGQIKVLAKRSA